MPIKPDAESKLERLADGLVHSLFELSDRRVLDEAAAAGEDPEASAGRVRGVLLGAVARHRKGRLARARTRLGAARKRVRRRHYDLPGTPEERKALLIRAFESESVSKSSLTVQHRDLRGLPDEDVTAFLIQLAELGLLDER